MVDTNVLSDERPESYFVRLHTATNVQKPAVEILAAIVPNRRRESGFDITVMPFHG